MDFDSFGFLIVLPVFLYTTKFWDLDLAIYLFQILAADERLLSETRVQHIVICNIYDCHFCILI